MITNTAYVVYKRNKANNKQYAIQKYFFIVKPNIIYTVQLGFVETQYM